MGSGRGAARSNRAGPGANGRAPEQLTVVLVQNDPDLARFAILTLRLGGYRTLSVASGDAAVAVAQKTRTDVVLLDLRPRRRGWRALRCLQTAPALRAVPVVGLLAAADTGVERRARTAGVKAHLVQPVSADALLTVVGRVLRDRRPEVAS